MWVYQKDLEQGTADFPAIPRTILENARKSGALPYLKIGVKVAYEAEDIQKYLQSLKKSNNSKKTKTNATN